MAYCHVWPAASVATFGYGIHQLSADAEITELDVPLAVQQYIGRLYI